MFGDIENEYDVVVVGVGPTGAGVARFCAEKGLSVLALEKRQEIGSPKRCGEGLSKAAVERMGISLEDSWKIKTIRGASIYSPDMKKIKADFRGPEGWVIERKIFDKHLAKIAAKAGARIITKADVFRARRENKSVLVGFRHQGETYDVKAKILVACDGVESRVARMMGINTTLSLENICSCAQYEMTNVEIDPDMLELYFGNQIAPGGYVWIFPKGEDTANVGIGVRKPFSEKSALTYLDDFIKNNEKLRRGSIIEANGGGVPVGGFLDTMVDDNFIIAGDAAHQVNPIHGGGISEGYVSAMIAAEVIAKAFRKNDFSRKTLSEYDKRWNAERGKKLKRILKLRKVVESLSDDELNWLVEYLKGEQLIDLAKASGFKKLAFVLMKKPKLVGIARKLL